MKLKPETIYAPLFILLLLVQLYLPSFKVNLAIQIVVLMVFCFMENATLSKKMIGQVGILLAILLLGFIGTLLHKYNGYNVIKDVFHFIKPVVGILIGYLFFRRIDNFRVFVRIIVIAGVISALIHFYILFFKVNLMSGSVARIRHFTRDNFLELFSIFFLVFYRKYEGKQLFSNIIFRAFAFVLLLFSSMLYLSRTMIVMAIILLITVYGYTKITKKTLAVAGVGIAGIALLFVYLNNANIRRGKPGLEGFLYKVKMAPEEIFVTNINRDDHRDLWDHWRGYEAMRAYALMKRNPSSFIVGTGHGSLVNLKFYAPLSGTPEGLRYISELHNGYMYVFYKIGAIGILLYLFILLRWYSYIYKRKTFANVFVSGIGAVYIFSSITITGLFNGRDVIIFILGGLLYYSAKANNTPKAIDVAL
ncbi:O-antigen ligase family protein [Flavobacterium litorale]|uniref:O-antigen ligase family protein n=1 Tax=Flavobacterium litorale TaxID=2856519 RepID=A0ABX8V8A8_9FLAO|nr:O-antigen ligase family protein [Flavobacterium litorale]QYJ69065.1 O-antigen ligase family protein [Flavobacterium litorale]